MKPTEASPSVPSSVPNQDPPNSGAPAAGGKGAPPTGDPIIDFQNNGVPSPGDGAPPTTGVPAQDAAPPA